MNTTQVLNKAASKLKGCWQALCANEGIRLFFKKHALLLGGILFFVVWTLAVSAISRHNTTVRVTEEVTQRVTTELRAGFNQTLVDHGIDPETYEKKTAPLVDDASFLAMVDELALSMDDVVSTYAMDFGVGEEGQMTIAWVWCARYSKNSTEFGKTPQEVTGKPSAWEGQVVGHATQNQYTELCRKVATDYLKGMFPDDFTTDLTFFNREGTKIIARNDLYDTNAYTIYWWYGK